MSDRIQATYDVELDGQAVSVHIERVDAQERRDFAEDKTRSFLDGRDDLSGEAIESGLYAGLALEAAGDDVGAIEEMGRPLVREVRVGHDRNRPPM